MSRACINNTYRDRHSDLALPWTPQVGLPPAWENSRRIRGPVPGCRASGKGCSPIPGRFLRLRPCASLRRAASMSNSCDPGVGSALAAERRRGRRRGRPEARYGWNRRGSPGIDGQRGCGDAERRLLVAEPYGLTLATTPERPQFSPSDCRSRGRSLMVSLRRGLRSALAWTRRACRFRPHPPSVR